MKKGSRAINRAVFLLAAIVILSGCVGQDGGVLQSIMDVRMVGGGTEDMTITAKVPEFARANRDFNWQIVVQPSIDAKEFTASIYDHGLFTNLTPDDFAADAINANTTKIFPISYRMNDPGLAEKTDVKLRAFYKSNATISTTVAVLNEVEYFQRKASGTLGGIPTSTWTSTNPLQLTVSWSDPMPLLDAQGVQMYVDYQNLGDGFIEKLAIGEVVFHIPRNIRFLSCDDYNSTSDGSVITLKRNIDIIQGKGKRSTCTFEALASGPIDSESLVGVALYTYELDSKITVPIIQK